MPQQGCTAWQGQCRLDFSSYFLSQPGLLVQGTTSAMGHGSPGWGLYSVTCGIIKKSNQKSGLRICGLWTWNFPEEVGLDLNFRRWGDVGQVEMGAESSWFGFACLNLSEIVFLAHPHIFGTWQCADREGNKEKRKKNVIIYVSSWFYFFSPLIFHTLTSFDQIRTGQAWGDNSNMSLALCSGGR